MQRSRFYGKALFGAILVLICGVTPARAGFDVNVSETTTQVSSNLYLYTYVVTNSATSTMGLTEFDLAVNDPIGLTAISAPGNFFTFYNPGDPFISFTAFDGGIAPGSSGTFAFESTSAPGMVTDLSRGIDFSGSSSAEVAGMIVGPSIVPEPSSLLMLSLGSVGVLGLAVRSRRLPQN